MTFKWNSFRERTIHFNTFINKKRRLVKKMTILSINEWCTFLITTFNPIFEIYKNRKRKNLKILWSYLIHWRLSHKLRILKGFSIWCLKIISQNSIGVCIDHLDWLNSNENKIVKVILIKSMAVDSESSRLKIR